MFAWLNKTGVESDLGFVVQSMDRCTVEYREGGKTASVYVERGLAPSGKPCLIIESNAFERWDGDPPWVHLPLEKQRQMLANFVAANEFKGLEVLVG